MSWRETSLQIIDERFRSIKQAQPQLSDAEILRMVSLNYYPFGARENHPYQQWLKAMKQYREALAGTNQDGKITGPLFEEAA